MITHHNYNLKNLNKLTCKILNWLILILCMKKKKKKENYRNLLKKKQQNQLFIYNYSVFLNTYIMLVLIYIFFWNIFKVLSNY